MNACVGNRTPNPHPAKTAHLTMSTFIFSWCICDCLPKMLRDVYIWPFLFFWLLLRSNYSHRIPDNLLTVTTQAKATLSIKIFTRFLGFISRKALLRYGLIIRARTNEFLRSSPTGIRYLRPQSASEMQKTNYLATVLLIQTASACQGFKIDGRSKWIIRMQFLHSTYSKGGQTSRPG